MKSNILYIPYSTWKEVCEHQELQPYHIIESSNSVTAWCGYPQRDIYFCSSVSCDDYSDWANNFPSSIVAVSEDDALAKIIGIDATMPSPEVRLAGTPIEADGRLNIVNAPMTHGMSAWWTGVGDDLNPIPPSSGRGMGEAMNFVFSGVNDQTITLDFSSYVEIYDGEGIWHPTENWSIEDRFWVSAYIRSNQDLVTDNLVGSGNCNVVNTGQGFSIIVPAAGDGAYDIDLAKARPAPASAGSQVNYWYTGKYYLENITTLSVDSQGNPTGDHALFYDLAFNIPFCNDMPMGSPTGKFEIDSDKSEPLHRNWQIKVRCKRMSTGAGKFAVWLKFFRPNTVEYVFG